MSTLPGAGKRAGDATRGTVLSANSIIGDHVANRQQQKLGSIDDIMLDAESGEFRYALLSAAGVLDMGDKLLAIPWRALHLDESGHGFLLDVDVERLKHAPGFDRGHWPDMADPTWIDSVDSYFTTASPESPPASETTPVG